MTKTKTKRVAFTRADGTQVSFRAHLGAVSTKSRGKKDSAPPIPAGAVRIRYMSANVLVQGYAIRVEGGGWHVYEIVGNAGARLKRNAKGAPLVYSDREIDSMKPWRTS